MGMIVLPAMIRRKYHPSIACGSFLAGGTLGILIPPSILAILYLKSVAPPEVSMGQIYRSSLPFLVLQALGLAICIIFPEVVLWLPRQVYGGG